MTADESLRMAREAGLLGLDAEGRLERFRKLAYEAGVRAEREACADICDQHASVEGIAQRCAEQIRARSKT
jgi:hypothetical protein